VKRRHLTFLLKLTVSLALLWLVLSRLTWLEVRDALDDPHWGWLAAALAVYGVSALGGAQLWVWILRAAGLATGAGEVRRLYLIGLFFNNFLPANVGGDAYKIVVLGRREGQTGRVFCATLLDRLLGLGALTVGASLAALGCLAAGVALPGVAAVLILVLLLLGGVLAVLVSRRLGALLPRLLERLRLVALARRAALIAREFQVYRPRLRWLVGIFLFSLAVQALRIAVHLLVAAGLRLEPSAAQTAQLAVLVPLLALSLTLPVTVNGIGLRETISSTLLIYTGLAAHAMVAMEMTAFLIMVLFSLVGGVLWWRRGRSVAAAAPPPA
jgi:glycosyltransferase 2 family protein